MGWGWHLNDWDSCIYLNAVWKIETKLQLSRRNYWQPLKISNLAIVQRAFKIYVQIGLSYYRLTEAYVQNRIVYCGFIRLSPHNSNENKFGDKNRELWRFNAFANIENTKAVGKTVNRYTLRDNCELQDHREPPGTSTRPVVTRFAVPV